MLKALELCGFKSFADKTRFEFPAGITVVVGPNGSGKSNIVDGIKWVLGEQSAKSLRGREMADVIFKGSGAAAGGRKPAGAAEATLVFDNTEGRLPVDAPEVHITRRVYRSGEGEYLINRQPARLKDIRDMFRGTGVGGDAYSLIEQGKVDRLLQASAKDRRAIFEEAAGISRFKAKKIEAQRRLERVEQNLLRLSDIVEEVENRLRSVRNQASKAKRYREYSQRLQQLRTEVALADWRKLNERIEAGEQELAALREQTADALAQGEARQALLLESETSILACQEQLRAAESLAATNREQIAEREATAEQQRGRLRELIDETSLCRSNLSAMSDRAGDVTKRLRETQAELLAAKEECDATGARLAESEAQAASLTEHLTECRRQRDAAREAHVAQLQAIAVMANRIEADQQHRAAAEQSANQCRQQLADLQSASAELLALLDAARQQERQVEADGAARQAELESLAQELSKTRRLHESRVEDLAQLQSRRRGLSERASLLDELERTLEGLGAGVKEALAKIKARSDGPLTLVRSLLADLIAVKVEHAAAIDIALGEAAQAIVIQGGMDEVEQVIAALGPLAGRVTFLATDAPAPGNERELPNEDAAERNAAEVALRDLAIGRADELVDVPAEYSHLARRLLAGVWVAGNRAVALAMWHACGGHAGLRFVTLEGELLDATGALSLGPRQSATSIISRRSELRSLRGDLAVLAEQIQASQTEVVALKEQIEVKESSLRELTEFVQQSMRGAADVRVRIRTLEERAQQNAQQAAVLEATLARSSERRLEFTRSLNQTTDALAAAEAEASQTRAAMAGDEAREAELDRRRQQVSVQATAERVELARREQRLESLQVRLSQFQDDERERTRAVQQVRQQLAQSEMRRRQAELEILHAQGDLALAYLRKEELARDIATQSLVHAQTAARRTVLAEEAQQAQKVLRRLEEQQHQLELAAGQVRHERQTLLDRFHEDYQLDLSEVAEQQSADEASSQQRTEVEAEIESLRRKIHQIGAVNLDALEELDELEARFSHLAGQHKDLTEAKQALERIIHKINADSRRLFVETLEGIRSNFQTLYRKAFGGGKADIMLEEGVDVLDAGVEIIATPPGKPSFNNSLLSGGEKALTAVALLLAIFQFRPSPFCVLDEVDAPFDEANIGRFIDVLNDFLGWTKFIIVTHSKKTMTAATTLYGVTMQESGVSKRVSVRFDDVTEDGHIKQEALDRQRHAEPDAEVA